MGSLGSLYKVIHRNGISESVILWALINTVQKEESSLAIVYLSRLGSKS